MKHLLHSALICCLALSFFSAISARADDEENRGFGANVGTAWLWGRVSGVDGLYPDRQVAKLTLNANPGYYYGSFFAGVDFSYRFVTQNESEAPNSPSLKGHGWLAGLKLDYRQGPWILGGGLRFLGRNSPSSGNKLFSHPLGWVLTLGYQLFPHTPLTADANVEYTRFHQLTGPVGQEVEVSPLIAWGAGLGLTYRFGPQPKLKDSTEVLEEIKEGKEP